MLSDEKKCALLRRLITDNDETIHIILAMQKIPDECACEIVKTLSENESKRVRRFTIQYQHDLPDECSCDIINQMAESGDRFMRRTITVYQSKLPDDCACDLFGRFANDSDDGLRAAVARKRTLPNKCACEIMEKLRDDKDIDVSTNAMMNPLYERCKHAN